MTYISFNTTLAQDELGRLGARLVAALGPRESDGRLVFRVQTASGQSAQWVWDDVRFAFRRA